MTLVGVEQEKLGELTYYAVQWALTVSDGSIPKVAALVVEVAPQLDRAAVTRIAAAIIQRGLDTPDEDLWRQTISDLQATTKGKGARTG